ncbi:MAG: lytic transglycosylase domain-containing protein, partial [Oscillospiraceae bacterium]
VNRIHYDELSKQLAVTDLRDPKQNIESGIYIFSKLLHKYGDYHKALVCYNCGEKGAKDKLTSNYSISVINYASSLEVKQCSIVQ